MTRNCVALSCALISLLVLTAPAFAQGTAPEILGTPPPEGHMIEEIATTTELRGFGGTLQPGVPVTGTVPLPLPVFDSGPTAVPSQCLWSVLPIRNEVEDLEEPADYQLLDISYTLDGSNLIVELLIPPDAFTYARWFVDLSVSAVAIRTAPPAPVESKSFGEIKAMFRDE